jgi:CHAD domain-containing protein
MSRTKPWEIPKLSIKQNLATSAKIILRQRLKSFLSSLKLYLSEVNPENLHLLRISLRRLRYPMELFIKCFDRKTFLSFYKIISSLQDLSGQVRDLDILRENINIYFINDKSEAEGKNFKKIDIKREQLQNDLKFELMKFLHGKELKDFKKLINRHI